MLRLNLGWRQRIVIGHGTVIVQAWEVTPRDTLLFVKTDLPLPLTTKRYDPSINKMPVLTDKCWMDVRQDLPHRSSALGQGFLCTLDGCVCIGADVTVVVIGTQPTHSDPHRLMVQLGIIAPYEVPADREVTYLSKVAGPDLASPA